MRSIDPNAYAVLIGRVLELVCSDRKAKGNSLNNKLQDLADRQEIPEKLVGVADGLRNFRNVGAHPSLGELTESEIPILDDLSKAILEYVYTAPYLAAKAEQRFNELKQK